MSDALLLILWAVAVIGAYREWCVFRFYLARRTARRERFRGLRLVIDNRGVGSERGDGTVAVRTH